MEKKRYVKVEGYPDWFLCISPDDAFDIEVYLKAKEKLVRGHVSSLHGGLNKSNAEYSAIVMKGIAQMDYFELAKKYDSTLLIRRIGSYMMLRDDIVITHDSSICC